MPLAPTGKSVGMMGSIRGCGGRGHSQDLKERTSQSLDMKEGGCISNWSFKEKSERCWGHLGVNFWFSSVDWGLGEGSGAYEMLV